MERKKASDFPQELLNLFDGYVHGRTSRRDFLAGAQRFAVAGVTAAALLDMLRPNYAWAIQVPPDDKRITPKYETVPSPQGKCGGQREDQGADQRAICRTGHAHHRRMAGIRCRAHRGARPA